MVENWWQHEIGIMPPLPSNRNLGIIGRHVATCRYEDIVFMLMAKNVGLTPLWLQYTRDQMVDCSNGKTSLLTPFLCDGLGKGGGPRTRKVTLAKISQWKNRPICDITVNADGSNLVDWHNKHQDTILGEHACRIDASEWLKAAGGNAARYYEFYLSLFIAHGVLFEDYHGGESTGNGQLDGFTERVFEPAWERVCNRFDATPLIVRLPWESWMSLYPANSSWRNHDIVTKPYLDLEISPEAAAAK